MIRLITDLPEFSNDIGEVIRLFLGGVDIRLDDGDRLVRHEHAERDGRWIERFTAGDVSVVHAAKSARGRGALIEKKLLKRAVKTACFQMMRQITGECPPWGSLTGIRPTRLMYELIEEGLTEAEARARLSEEFYVSSDKTALLQEILDMQRGLTEVPDGQFDLYIGIPFCRTRCSYCSFAAGVVGDGRQIEPYLDALISELRQCAAMTAERGLTLRAGYVGGGTPTAIAAGQLARVLDEAMGGFPGAREWTVEAGRPDSIDREKLQVLKARGVGRISVNPQTFSDQTLRRIGRDHSARDAVAAFELAREVGFKDINMDLIAALPGEDRADFERTLSRAVALNPESVTVHTLALKRSSKLHEQNYRQADAAMAADMVALARARLGDAGYKPYYLYRQKYMAGNLENVGYAKPGKACLYNIDHMEERARVLALGAGAITKWLFPRERRIERAPNVREIGQYIDRVDEMVARKLALIDG